MAKYIGNNSTSSYLGRNSVVQENVDILRSNSQTLLSNVTVGGTENSSCAGPLTVGTGVTITVLSGGNLTIV